MSLKNRLTPGCDIRVYHKGEVISAQRAEWSMNRNVQQIIGPYDPDYREGKIVHIPGKTTITGSLQLLEDEHLSEEFVITLTAANEYGAVATMAIHGCTALTQTGRDYTFAARRVGRWREVNG